MELTNDDFFLDIAKGKIHSHLSIDQYGINPSVSTAAEESVWTNGGDYVTPTQARIHSIISSDVLNPDIGALVSSGTADNSGNFGNNKLIDSGADFVSDGVQVGDIILNDSKMEYGIVSEVNNLNQLSVLSFYCVQPHVVALCRGISEGDSYRIVNASGTGAAVIAVQGFNEGLNYEAEFIILNGNTIVNTIKSYARMFKSTVLLTGITNFSVGIITMTAAVDNTVSLVIPANENQSQTVAFTVPRNFTGFVTSWWSILNEDVNAAAFLTMDVKPVNGASIARDPIGSNSRGVIFSIRPLKVPRVIQQMHDIDIRVNVTDNAQTITAGFNIILVKNEFLKIENLLK